MSFTDVERVLQSCMVGIDDSDAERLQKRERRQLSTVTEFPDAAVMEFPRPA